MRSRPRGTAGPLVIALTVVGLGVLLAQRSAWRGDKPAAELPDHQRRAGRDRSLSTGRATDDASDRFSDAFERGVAAYNADDAETAVDAFEEAVRLAPDNAEARINLGLVYMRLQRPQDAMRELETGAQLERERSQKRKHGRGNEGHRRTDTIRE